MSNALTVRVPSPQPATPAATVRGFARRGNDGPDAGSTGFDAVLADHAVPATSPRAKARPGPADRRPNADEFGATRTSDLTANPGPAMKPTLPVKKREDEDHCPPAARAPLTVSSATDPACPIAVDATAPSETGALTASGVGVVPVVPALVPSTLPPTASGTAAPQQAVAPDARSGGTSAVVTAGVGGVGGVLPGRIGQEAPESPVLGVVSPLSRSAPSATAPFVSDARPVAPAAPVMPPAATPAVPPVLPPPVAPVVASRGSGHTSAALSASAGDVVPGGVGQEVPTAVGPNGVPVLTASVRSETVPIAPAVPLVVPVVSPVLASVVVPVVSPVVTLRTGSGHTMAVVTAGSGAQVAQVAARTGPEATTPNISSPVQPVDAVTTATWTQTQGTDSAPVTGVEGPPTATGLSVVPALSTSVPPTTLQTVSTAPATGQPAGSLFPEPVHQQVYTAVSPLLRGADGSYGIQLNLHPDDLGAVRVNVDVRHGEISIQMHATDPAARDALRNGLSDLRQQLEGQGLRAGSMNVGSGGANARQPETSWSRSQGVESPQHSGNPSDQLVATAAAASSSALDLRM